MIDVDLWFAKYEDNLFYVLADHDQEPEMYPIRTSTVGRTIASIREGNCRIVQVGILPPEMLGLE